MKNGWPAGYVIGVPRKTLMRQPQGAVAYCNARVSSLLAAAFRHVRLDRRVRLLNRADALVARDVPLLPLYVMRGYALYNAKIRNIRWNPDTDYLVFSNAQDWWIEPQ
jgi:ABC-type transport system substrate-binding protein